MGAQGKTRTYIIKDGVLDSSYSLTTVGYTRGSAQISTTLVNDALRFAYSNNGKTASRTTDPLIIPKGATKLYIELQAYKWSSAGIYVTVAPTAQNGNSLANAYPNRVYFKDVINNETKTTLEIDISSLTAGFIVSITLDTWAGSYGIYVDVFNAYIE